MRAELGVNIELVWYGYNLLLRARSSMDRIRVSEALDTGSIPVGRATAAFVTGQCWR